MAILFFLGRFGPSGYVFGQLLHLPPEIYKPIETAIIVIGLAVLGLAAWRGDPKVMSDGEVGRYSSRSLTALTLAIAFAMAAIVLVMVFGALPEAWQAVLRAQALTISLGLLALVAVAWLVDTLKQGGGGLLVTRLVFAGVGGGLLALSRRFPTRPDGPDWGFPDGPVLYVWIAILVLGVSCILHPPRKPARPGQA